MSRYEQVLQEHFDITDDYTRSTLLAIDEVDQNRVMDSLASKLYQSIIDKVDDIDFGSIPDSKGDITKIENFDKLIECINVIKEMLTQYNQDLKQVRIIETAIENMSNRVDIFTKGFTMHIDLIEVLYNTIVLSIVSSVSLIIATSIEFVKDAGDQGFDIKFDKVAYIKTKDNLLFTNLDKFNKTCANGELDETLEHIYHQSSKQLLGLDPLAAVGGIAIVGLILNIIPILRELVFFFFHIKQSISDYYDIQADLLLINAEYVKNNPMSGKTMSERNAIAKKQTNIAMKFRKIANALAIDNRQAEQKAASDIKKSEKKNKLEDVTKEKLDSAPEPVQPSQSSIF